MKSKPTTSNSTESDAAKSRSRTIVWCGLALATAAVLAFAFQLLPAQVNHSADVSQATAELVDDSLTVTNDAKLAQANEDRTHESDTAANANSRKTTDRNGDQSELDEAQSKALSERERRLKSLAKAVEKEERPEKPKFEGIARNKNGNITFDDIKFEMEKTERFQRSMLTDDINALVGETIQIKGYIRPSIRQKGLTKFIFVRDDKECCFGPGAALFDCILVKLADGKKCNFSVRPITIEGEFYLKEYTGPDGRIWAVYRMKNSSVK